MSSGAPWSVKGIDPKAREVAKDLARRSGMTLGEWLNRMILDEDGPEEPGSESFFTERAPPRFETPRAAEPSARWGPEFSAIASTPRFATPPAVSEEMHRMAAALERLTERIEISETRTGQAMGGVEQSVREAIARIEAAEREQIAIAARFEGAVEEGRSDQSRLAERLRRIELETTGPRSSEALRVLEQAVGKIAGQVYETETRNREDVAAVASRLEQIEGRAALASVEDVVVRLEARLAESEQRAADALTGLRDSFTALDGRLGAVEGGVSEALNPRLEQLAASLADRVEAVRSELAEQVEATAQGRFDQMDSRLDAMAAHVRQAEQNSTRAIERMGREVLTLAEGLNRRVLAAENRNAEAIEQVGGEVARIGRTMTERLTRAELTQADALEKLGGEINKISERLAERMTAAERRSAHAIDEVGEQVARVTERLGERTERVSEEIADRIRQSEERTARLLDEARETIAEAQRRQEMLAAAVVAEPPAHEPPSLKAAEAESTPQPPLSDDPFPGFGLAEPEQDPLARPGLAEALAEPFVIDAFDEDIPPPQFDAADFEAADGFAPIADPEQDQLDLDMPAYGGRSEVTAEAGDEPQPPKPWRFEPAFAPVSAEVEAKTLSTREVVERARAAAIAAQAPAKPSWSRKAKVEGAGPASFFAGFGGRPKSRPGSTLQTALVVATCAASLGVAAGGLTLLEEQGAIDPEGAPAPMAAVALSPRPIIEPEATDPAEAFDAAVSAMQSGDPEGLDRLRQVAAQGHAPAQFFLAKLYEKGEAGVAVDLPESRMWAERAAAHGSRPAMYMLAEFYLHGTGGEKDPAAAALWFRRAADLGWVKAQFALGALHEQGLGVSANLAEAYKWYLVASRSGDADARQNALRVRPLLSADARIVAERSAGGFRTRAVRTAASTDHDSRTVLQAQQALAKLGYYQGPIDGAGVEALRPAVAAYQRQVGLSPTGALDSATISRLAVYTR